MIEVDCRGLSCPEPVVRTKKALKDNAEIDVIVDNRASLENVKRYARNGSIITFHDSLKSIDKLHTALPQSIEWLKSQGYAFKVLE